MALKLAYCLLEFFDSVSGFPVWDSTKIYFISRPRAGPESGRMYVTFASESQQPFTACPEVGNPILIAFAKLLLEVDRGSEIDLSQYDNNIAKWAQLCVYAQAAERAGSGLLAQAIRGCLYLHLHIPKESDQKAGIRKCLYEQVVSQLEAAVNPPTRKRRRAKSPDEFDPGTGRAAWKSQVTSIPQPRSQKKSRTVTTGRGVGKLPIRHISDQRETKIDRYAGPARYRGFTEQMCHQDSTRE